VNYYTDSTEWQWLFNNAINWQTNLDHHIHQFPTEDGIENKEEYVKFLGEILESTGEWCANSVLEIGNLLEQQGAGKVVDGKTVPSEALTRAIREATELSVFGIPVDQKFGGLGAPVSTYFILLSQISRSCVSTTTTISFFTGMAEMLERYCSEEMKEKYIPMVCEGKISGSMNLTEPAAGSDLSLLKTTATPQDDGTYLLNGEKIFITNGGGGLGFVLAKIQGAPDTLDGISMFFVEQEIEGNPLNFKVEKNEDKMGLKGSFTTVVTYENSKAYLCGEAGKGMKYMFHLMNEARLCVGMQALGGIEFCVDFAKKYADERTAFGKPISELPLLKRFIKDIEVEQDAIRAMAVDTASWFDLYHKLDAKKWETGDLNEKEEKLFKEASYWVRKRTPLIKYYTTEAFVDISKKAIQVLGGYGFMKEYPLERFHRDSFGPLLYEGTSQIQALMALKDIVKHVVKDPGKFIGSLFFTHPSTAIINRENSWSRSFKSTYFRFKKNMTKLIFKSLKPDQINKLWDVKEWQTEEGISQLMIHAETLCQALCYTETLRVLCSHANKDVSRIELYENYRRLITPRLEAIYKDWELRS
jgi:alkylation response protein AidB-like acyl-CoA dehydrogenase